MKQQSKLEKLETLLCNYTTTANNNEMLVTCLPSIRNVATDHVMLGFSGWHVKLFEDGTWELHDTGGCLKGK